MSITGLTYQFLDPAEILQWSELSVCQDFLRTSRRSAIGWHYIIDLTWIYAQAQGWPAGSTVLDVGGGSGPTQFLLAEMGFDVVNIDLNPAAATPRYRSRYRAAETTLSGWAENGYVRHLLSGYSAPSGRAGLRRLLQTPLLQPLHHSLLAKRLDGWRQRHGWAKRPVGTLSLTKGDICKLHDVPSGCFDAVVSLSSLEHVPIDDLPAALAEIERVSKPTAFFAMTTSATDRAETWFHEPSKGYCYSEDTLRHLFGARSVSRLGREAALDSYRRCEFLRANLAGFYAKSGENGMPWGVWNPEYFPVALAR